MRDEVFKEELGKISDFEFNEAVASVFDDMVSRSIPNYDEIHKIISDMCRRAYKSGRVYDLGCSTGTTLRIIGETFRKMEKTIPEMVGIDNSAPMLEKAAVKLKSHGLDKYVTLEQKDLAEVELEESGMVIMNYTLQFLPKEQRAELLKKVYNSLSKDGVFILAEKVICHDEDIDKLIVDLYYDFKRRNGYSEMEISQKREALENVMRPITPSEQIDMLKEAGFIECEMIFRWYNFCCYLGIKKD
jgi:tRNA (cmo5U34)-methyltransferase